MDKFLDDEFILQKNTKMKIEEVNCLAGEGYLDHIEEINKNIEYDTLNPNLFELNYVIMLNTQIQEKNNIKKLEKRKK